MKNTAYWILLDLPENNPNGNIRLGYLDGEEKKAEITGEITPDMTIIEGINSVLEAVKKKGLNLHGSFTLVFPMDDRHQLAGMLLDVAENYGWEFERHIPKLS